MNTQEPIPSSWQQLKPNFEKIFKGIWSFTWRNQLSWAKLSSLCARLLPLPILVFFTVNATQREHEDPWSWQSRPGPVVNEFQDSLKRAGFPMKKQVRQQMLNIVNEELEKTRAISPGEKKTPIELLGQMRDFNIRLNTRAAEILDPNQLGRLQEFETTTLEKDTRHLDRSVNGQVAPFYRWLLEFYFLIILPLFCLSICGGMIRDELQSDTLGFLLTRPVSRMQLFIAQYLSNMICLQVFCLVEAILIFTAGLIKHAVIIDQFVVLFAVTQVIAVATWSAFGSFFGLVSRRYLIFGVIYGLIVEEGIGRIPTNINHMSLTRQLRTLLANNSTIEHLYGWLPDQSALAIGILLGALVLFLCAGAALFTYREYHHVEEMQK